MIRPQISAQVSRALEEQSFLNLVILYRSQLLAIARGHPPVAILNHSERKCLLKRGILKTSRRRGSASLTPKALTLLKEVIYFQGPEGREEVKK